MNFKKTVAGISAAAIAVTQVAAVIPMGTFAASEQPVESGVGFALKLTSKGGDTYSYDRAYLSENDNKVVLGADDISASGENKDLAFSYGGLITENDTVEVGDRYTFTADGLKIVANKKDETTTVLEGPCILYNDRINVENAGDADDVVTIAYTKGKSDISVVDSNGVTISSDTSTEGICTFALTDDSASKFTILGGGITVSSVEVTKTKTTDLEDIYFDFTEKPKTITIPNSAIIGDKNTVVISYDAVASGGSDNVPAKELNVSGDGISNIDNDGEILTFDLDSSTSEFTLTGVNCDGTVKLISSKTTDLNISDYIGDPITVSGNEFANAKVGDEINIRYSGEDIAVRSGENELALSNDKITIDADNIDSIKTNGIALTASEKTLYGVDLISKGEAAVLFESDDPVVWSQTWTDGTDGGYWSDEQSISTSKISDNIGTVAAFKENYENITATWDSLTATKFVLDEGELWAGEHNFSMANIFLSIHKADVKKGGKIIVEYKGAEIEDEPGFILCDSKKSPFGSTFASKITKTNGSVEFVLDEEVAQEISTNDFFIGVSGCRLNTNLTVTSVKYEAPVEKKIDINSENFPDENFRSVLALYDEDKDNKLSESEIENITELNSGHTEQAALKNAQNFKGIEKLTALEKIYIDGNTAVTAIDLSQNENLTIISTEDCTNLDDLKLPDGIKSIWIGNTAITELNTASFTNLADLSISETKITSLDVSANTKLGRLFLNKSKVTELDLTYNTKLNEISAKNSELAKLILPSGMNVGELNVTGSRLTSIDLSNVEFDADSEVQLSGNIRKIGTVVNGEYDLSKLIEEGLDVSKMEVKTEGVTLDGNVLKGITGIVEYDYDTGSTVEGLEKVTFTLAPENLTESSFVVKYNNKSVACETWDEVIKAMNDKNADYAVLIAKDVSVDKLTFPTAAKAKSVSISRNTTEPVTITTKSASVTIPTNALIAGVNIEAVDNNGKQAKSFTISASKDLNIENLSIKADKAVIKGAAKSTLTIGGVIYSNNTDVVAAEINGFGTVDITDGYEVTFDRAVKAKDLKIGGGATAYFGTSTATFTNIESSEQGYIVYNTTNYTPVSVTGNITGEVMISVEKADGRYIKFASGDVILVSKNANLANIRLAASSSSYSHTVGRVGSNIAVMDAVFEMNGKKYAQWSDALSVIAANAKADKAAAAKRSYNVIISDTLNMNGAFKMPAAGTFDAIFFRSETSEMSTIKFTGNITIAGNTIFEGVKLDSVKNVKGKETSADFTISAGKNMLQIYDVKSGANIKSITSNDMVALSDVTVSSINAAFIKIYSSRFNGTDSYGALADENWEGKAIKNSSVTVTGNLTAKNELDLMGSLAVKGVLNAAQIYSTDPDVTLVVYKQAKGKNALVIGKDGISNGSQQIKFVLADPETGKTAQITEDIVLGTIAGPYADQFVPSDDSLAETDDYRIIKDNKKLIAVPKENSEKQEYLVKVTVNGKAAYYKSLDEAIKDISATGRNTDDVVITVTQDMFTGSVAKLPLPTAGKYGTLTYTADSNVTINVTSDLTLTGDLVLDGKVALNKVNKDGDVLPISVNVGKYTLTANGFLSADETGETIVNQLANISGTGEFVTDFDTEITGRVTGTTLVLDDSIVTLGDRATFNASIYTTTESTLAYTNAKNVKFVSVTGEGLNIAGTFAENATVANITGDYTKDAVVIDGELKVVRSGSTLKAVKAENVVEVEARGGSSRKRMTLRTYDSLTSAINDISRIKDEEVIYSVPVKNGDVITLPKAKTYLGIVFTSEEAVTVTTAKDLVLTGGLKIDANITVKKTDGKAVSVTLGNYEFRLLGKVAPDADGVSQFNNVSGKGIFDVNGKAKINGKINVGTAYLNELELGSKSAFSASVIKGTNQTSNADVDVITLKYPLSIAKNVKLGNIGENNGLNLIIDGVKEGDQVAVLTGDYYYGTVILNGFDPEEDEDSNSRFIAVRSGSKLMATTGDNLYFVYCSANSDNNNEENTKYIAYYSYADVIADINRLDNSDGIYILGLPENAAITKLTLPAKNKYNTLGIVALYDDDVTLKLTSDVALTGNLYIGQGIILQKKDGGEKDILKFTSPKDKDKKPIYTVTAADGGVIVNGTLNGEKIDSPEKPIVENVTLPYTNEDGFDLSNRNKLKIAKTDVEEGGIITVTTAEEVSASSIDVIPIGDDISIRAAHTSGTKVYTYTISENNAELITKNGFTVTGSEGKVTEITYTAPAPETTSVTELPWEGSVEFDSEGSGKTLEVAKGLLEAGKDDEDTTTVTITFTGNGDSSALTITDNAGNKLGEAASLSGGSAAIKLTKAQAQKCFSEGFKIKGTSVTVTGVSFKVNTNATPDFGI